MKGYILFLLLDDVFCCVRFLGFLDFRIIYFFVYGVLYGGIVFGIVYVEFFVENIVKKDEEISFVDVCF